MAPELAGWFEMREDFERNGPAGRTQEALDTFRRLSRRYSDTRFHHRYEAWQKAKATPGGAPQIVFSTYVLPHSYTFFGTAAGGGNQ